MASVGAKSVGRVSIRVIPDTTKLREDLNKALTRIERTTKLLVPVDANVDRARVTLNRLVKEFDGKEVTLQAGADAALASARITAAARPRIVPLHVQVSKQSLVKAASLLAGLSGARLAGDWVKRLSTNLSELDRTLPKMAGVAVGLSALVSVLLSSVGGLLTVGAGLASIAGAALVLPGILAGSAVGVGVLAVALSSAKDELTDLSPALRRVRDLIRENFWADARQPILDLVNGLLPDLEYSLGRTASSLGRWAASVSQSFLNAFDDGVLAAMIGQLNASIDIAATGTAGFAGAVATLGTIGSLYLPRLAQWFADINVAFDGWLAQAAADGRLQGWIDQGIIALGQLGGVIANTSSILAGLFRAAEASGGGGLASLEASLGRIAEIINGPQFQLTLGIFFSGAAAGAAGLASALAPIGDMLTALSPILAAVLADFGLLAGTIGTRLAEALSSPVFMTGLTAFFDGLMVGLDALLPSIPALVEGFAGVAAFAGTLAAQLGPVLGVAIQALVPILLAVLSAVTPLIPILGEALIQALPVLGTAFVDLITAITPLLPILVELITTALPQLVTLVQLATPVLAYLLQPTPVMNFVRSILELQRGFQLMAQALLGGMDPLRTVISAITGSFGPALQSVITIAARVGTAVREAFSGIGSAVRSSINGVIDVVNGAIGGVNSVTVAIGLPKLGTIPRLAMGADILPTPGGTAAILGEGGRRESVVDYGHMNRLILEVTSRLLKAGQSDGQQYPITVVGSDGMDRRLLARDIGREIQGRLSGRG